MFHELQEEFEVTKGVIKIRISKKNRQHNGQKKKLLNILTDICTWSHNEMFQEVVFGKSIVIGSGDHVPLLVAMDYKRATGQGRVQVKQFV